MRFISARLRVATGRAADQRDFYASTLELPTQPSPDGFTVTVGETALSFARGPGEPFYHFALLVPGDRFDAARTWIAQRVALLPHRASGEVVFDFPDWDARACYFHDPAANIVELIAHRDREANGRTGTFRADELRGLSELGLVGAPTQLAPPLTDALGLRVWDGKVADADALAFVGEQARTLILVPEGRGWLPTARPAELHPAEVTLSRDGNGDGDGHGHGDGDGDGTAELAGGLYRVRQRPQMKGPRGSS